MPNISRYVINLEDRIDRRDEMEKQLRRIGWSAEFLPGCRPSTAGGFPSIGAHGCFLSHLQTLKRGRATGKHVLIMEDDLNFAPGFVDLWEQTYDEIQRRSWSIFYPGHMLTHRPPGLSLLEPSMGVLCAHFVMIHCSAVETLVQALEVMLSRPAGHPLGGPMHVDGAYSTIRKQNSNLDTFVFSPSLGQQRPSRSDIANLRLYDRILTIRPAIRRLRRIKSHWW